MCQLDCAAGVYEILPNDIFRPRAHLDEQAEKIDEKLVFTAVGNLRMFPPRHNQINGLPGPCEDLS